MCKVKQWKWFFFKHYYIIYTACYAFLVWYRINSLFLEIPKTATWLCGQRHFMHKQSALSHPKIKIKDSGCTSQFFVLNTETGLFLWIHREEASETSMKSWLFQQLTFCSTLWDICTKDNLIIKQCKSSAEVKHAIHQFLQSPWSTELYSNCCSLQYSVCLHCLARISSH